MTSDAPWNMTAFDQRFVEGGPPKLEDRGSYRTDRDAWEAVLRDDSLVIVEPTFLQTTGGPSGFIVKPGSKVIARDPHTGRTRLLTVAALSPSDYFIENGAFYGADGARTLFGYEPIFDRIVIALRPDVDPDVFAADAEAAFVANGAEAVSIPAIMDEGFTMTRQIFQLFQGYLAMGLIVGIAGTAVVMIRAVRERRRQIGTLRALGFGARPVGRSFAIESAFIAIEGTVIGALLALVTLYDIVSLSDSFGQLDVLGPVRPARHPARRDRRRLAARDRVAGPVGEPDPPRRGAAHHGLTSGSLSVVPARRKHRRAAPATSRTHAEAESVFPRTRSSSPGGTLGSQPRRSR